MSHITGTVQPVQPPLVLGPASGVLTTSYVHAPPAEPSGTKLLILHFHSASFPGDNRLEVDLGYGTDVFTADDGPSFWTRPVDPSKFPGGIPIRYIVDGPNDGSVTFDRYGRGERHSGEPGHPSFSNSDPFLPSGSFAEPQYDPYWVCNPPNENWENIRCLADTNDVRRRVARSVGMIVTVHPASATVPFEHVSTCTVTLVGAEMVITAGHCLHPEDAVSSSVTFDFEVECGGAAPGSYNPGFHKVKKVLHHLYAWENGIKYDYAFLQIAIPPGGLGLPIIPMRTGLPAVGEQVFCVHHPNGAVKKLSRPHGGGFATIFASSMGAIGVNLDVSGGSSGSALFDTAGNALGVLAGSGKCSLGYFPTATALDRVEANPQPVAARDVMIVFDRSGSMSLPAGTGRSKMEEAQDAAALFVQLVRVGGGDRLGLVSFSTTASNPVDFALADVTQPTKDALIGPTLDGGVVGALAPGGNTTIGGGLDRARQQFPMPGPNQRTILLLTDGLQNTLPLMETVEPTLAGIDVNAIGFGTEGSLDGALLSQLVQKHNGVYTRAGDPLDLKKYFALAFGNIFAAGALLDPPFELPRAERTGKRVPFSVCGEESVTVVVGWDRPDSVLTVRVQTPAGAWITGAAPGVEDSTGPTWTFLRIPLPVDGERDGAWAVEVSRGGTGGGEFPPPPQHLRYFVQVIPTGGPRLVAAPVPAKLYTGDAFNPLVALWYPDGGHPHHAHVHVTVRAPRTGAGTLLSRSGLGAPGTRDGDAVGARQAGLLALEAASPGPLVEYAEHTFELFDTPAHDDGTPEPDGIFGTPLPELFTVEGDYTFHFRATYGEACTGTRELLRSLHVDVGVDPSRTHVRVQETGTAPGGGRKVTLTLVPQDRYGNPLGPGRAGDLTVSGGAGTTLAGGLRDNGDGSYAVDGTWNPGAGRRPSLVVGQPGRPPVVVQEPPIIPDDVDDCRRWKMLVWLLLILLIILILVLLFR
ncbi:MAG TPA: trypsin-like peptidase domain-containing protein [Longimicrobium sp.]|nr:trypsin-like peptidase domain-containing protein [Longimicrobium sp.]